MQSNHRPPSAALQNIVARHYDFGAELPDSFELVDNLLSETAFIRILLKGDWAALMPDGSWQNFGPVLLFGTNSRPFKVRCRGSFQVIGIAIRPAGWPTLFDKPAHLYTDRMLALGEVWGDDADRLLHGVQAASGDFDRIVAAVEEILLERIATRPLARPDPQMLGFEHIARHDSTKKVAEVCAELGIAQHALERRCRATFGMTPKRVLRRSRFLDMASVMRGLFAPDDEVLAGLRYSDQSHLSKEFREFIDKTPGQFMQTPTPLLTAGLELRNGSRYRDPAVELLAGS
jgi:AraC-like DNA-binding protein